MFRHPKVHYEGVFTYINRKTIKNYSKELKWNFYFPKIEHCTDNAAMIANYANYMFLDNQFSSYDIVPNPRLKF